MTISGAPDDLISAICSDISPGKWENYSNYTLSVSILCGVKWSNLLVKYTEIFQDTVKVYCVLAAQYRAQTGAMACTCLVKFLIYTAIWIVSGLNFPARSRAGDIDECVSLDLKQNQRIQQTVAWLVSVGIRTTGKYRTLVRELRTGGGK